MFRTNRGACLSRRGPAIPAALADSGTTAAYASLGGSVADPGEAMAVIALHVPGMTCRHRIRIVTARLRDMPGVIMVAADAVAAP